MMAMVFARLASIRPATSGHYAYTRIALGDFAGLLVAWGYWVSIWAGNAAIATAFVGYLSALVPGLGASVLAQAGAAVGSVWLLTWVNVRGVREAGTVQLVTTVLKLAPLVVIATVGLAWVEPANFTPGNRTDGPMSGAIFATAALTLWAFMGLESASIPAESVRDPKRTISARHDFTFMILLATLTALIAYVFTAAQLVMMARDPAAFADRSLPRQVLVASLALVYAIGAVAGAGQEIVYWGFLLLLGGVPIYAWVQWRNTVTDRMTGSTTA